MDESIESDYKPKVLHREEPHRNILLRFAYVLMHNTKLTPRKALPVLRAYSEVLPNYNPSLPWQDHDLYSMLKAAE